jgi:2-methylcitrate dehydratase PrpD
VSKPAAALAEFAAALRLASIPSAVRQSAALRVLDTLGCALAASREAWAPSVIGLASQWGEGTGPCSVIGSAHRATPPIASLVNGCLAHGLDFDDTHSPSIVHASSALVPAALALGECGDLPGGLVLTALVAGYEAVTRLGMAAPGRFHERGWHATAVCGAFGATVTAGRCLGLGVSQLISALGLAASMASGVLEFLEDGSAAKRLHPGWAAHSGILAATLASGGFTGPATGLEGRFGFYRAALGEAPDFGPALSSLGVEWETLRIAFKPYPCCHYNHAFIDAALAIRREHGVNPDDVAEVECLVPAGEVPVVCEPAGVKRRPRTPYEAQFSLPYTVAVALAEGRVGVGSFAAERIGDAAVLDLASRVRYSVDQESGFPATFPGWVRVRLRDGRLLERRQPANRGGPEYPLSRHEIIEKFRDNASRALPAERVRDLERAVLDLEGAGDCRGILGLCRAE